MVISNCTVVLREPSAPETVRKSTTELAGAISIMWEMASAIPDGRGDAWWRGASGKRMTAVGAGAA